MTVFINLKENCLEPQGVRLNEIQKLTFENLWF